MKDQVDVLKKRGISAAAMDSTQSKEQYLQTVDAMRDGNLDILYCAPERLNNEGFVSSMVCIFSLLSEGAAGGKLYRHSAI